MFFLALTSSYIVRRGVTTDWQAVSPAARFVGEYGRAAGEQLHD